MLSHKKEFSRFAKEYVHSNHLQKKIAKHLVSLRQKDFKNILDLGCGGGEVFNSISWDIDSIVAVDSSLDMCNLHPAGSNIKTIQADFDSDDLFSYFKKTYNFDVLIASSSVHWSLDIKRLFGNISCVADDILLSMFTNDSLKQLHSHLGVKSPLYSKNELIQSIDEFFTINTQQVVRYNIDFDSSKELFHFIKHTGISGGKLLSSVQNIFTLIRENTFKSLEFEVLFVSASLK